MTDYINQIIQEDNILEINNIKYGFWACQRPLTHKWGSGQIFDRISKFMGKPDVAFGKTDNIPDDVFYVDKSNNYDWIKLPFKDNEFNFGYWDPPYDHLYKKEGKEIWRCCKKLAILHTYIFPRTWLRNSIRLAMIAITFGPMKQIRCLQIFEKAG